MGKNPDELLELVHDLLSSKRYIIDSFLDLTNSRKGYGVEYKIAFDNIKKLEGVISKVCSIVEHPEKLNKMAREIAEKLKDDCKELKNKPLTKVLEGIRGKEGIDVSIKLDKYSKYLDKELEFLKKAKQFLSTL